MTWLRSEKSNSCTSTWSPRSLRPMRSMRRRDTVSQFRNCAAAIMTSRLWVSVGCWTAGGAGCVRRQDCHAERIDRSSSDGGHICRSHVEVVDDMPCRDGKRCTPDAGPRCCARFPWRRPRRRAPTLPRAWCAQTWRRHRRSPGLRCGRCAGASGRPATSAEVDWKRLPRAAVIARELLLLRTRM